MGVRATHHIYPAAIRAGHRITRPVVDMQIHTRMPKRPTAAIARHLVARRLNRFHGKIPSKNLFNIFLCRLFLDYFERKWWDDLQE